MEYKYVKKLVDFNEVIKFQEKNNIVLPNKLIEIIKDFNSSRPSLKRFDTDIRKEYVFKNFLSYNINEKENVYDLYPTPLKDVNIVPFGIDSSGNLLCLKKEKVILINHENLCEEKICENFDIFLNSLY